MTPGQYLSGVRFFEAKRLLLTTSLTVSNSVGRVGYTSVGTFTSKFTRAVGMSPTHYRHPEVRRAMLAISPEFQRLPALDLIRRARSAEGVRRLGAGAVDCAIELPRSAGRVHVLAGLFTDPIPQRAPVAYRAGSGRRRRDGHPERPRGPVDGHRGGLPGRNRPAPPPPRKFSKAGGGHPGTRHPGHRGCAT